MRWLVWFCLLVALVVAQPGWEKLSSKEGKFDVSMPGSARSSVVPLKTAAGSLAQFQFLVNLGERAFMVTYLDYPPETVEKLGAKQILDNVSEGVKRSGATVVEETELDLPDSMGRELLYTKEGGFSIHSRVLLVGNRFYQLTVARYGQGPDPDAKRFFESFQFSP